MLVFNKNDLLELADQYQSQFQAAQPYPHVVIDNFLPVEMADLILNDFPKPMQMEQLTYQTYENKIALRPDHPECPESIEMILSLLNSGKFITFLEVVTSIDGLLPDPHFSGAGLHQVMNGGKLGMHVDFNFHKGLSLYRRLNVLIYLNKDWQDDYGGHLELWDRDMHSCVKRILPVFNRCVIFETTSNSWHGHPNPIRVPDGVTRKSIALYYYTSTQGSQEREYHWTRHKERPNSISDRVVRPAEKLLYNWIPPIATSLVRKVASKVQNIVETRK